MSGAPPISVRLTVNGASREALAEPRLHLADFLRGSLGLTGAHVGCEHGSCGACTVLMGGRSVRACLVLAAQADGTEIVTVEGLAALGPVPRALIAAFARRHALQCGFCTPGILATLVELLDEAPEADPEAVREALSGHLCRCTGYHNIVAAVAGAQAALRGAAE